MTVKTEVAPAQAPTESAATIPSAVQAPTESAKAPPATPAAGTQDPATPAAAGTPAAPAAPAAPADVVLQFAEGLKVDQQLAGAFAGVAKEVGLDSAKAQRLADVYATHQAAQEKAYQAQAAAQQTQWRDAIQADPEIGGVALDANRVLAAKAMDRLGGPELRQILEQSGLGDHPAFVRVFVRVGKAISEDSISGTAAPARQADPEETFRRLYPSMYPPK